jgi:hypothetical protein
MGEKRAVETLIEVPLPRAEFDSLPLEHRAFFALLSHATNEITALSRIALQSRHEQTGEEQIDMLAVIQLSTLLRVWSSKLFEISSVFSDFGKDYSVVDGKLRDFILSRKVLFLEARKHPGYLTARTLRDNVTNHYSFKATLKSLNHLSDGANRTIQVHAIDGNTYYPYGEEVSFVAMLKKHSAGALGTPSIDQTIKHWMDWNVKSTRRLTEVMTDFSLDFVLRELSSPKGKKRVYWIPPEMVAEGDPATVALFLRKSSP